MATVFAALAVVLVALMVPRGRTGTEASSASPTTITFDEFALQAGFGPDPWWPGQPKGAHVTNQFQPLGVVFSTDVNGVLYISNDDSVGFIGSPSGENYLNVNSTPPNTTVETVMTAAFVHPLDGTPATADTFSVFVADSESEPSPRVTLRTFDADGVLLETMGLTSWSDILAFTLGGIARVEFLDNGGDGHVIDDFSFTLLTDQDRDGVADGNDLCPATPAHAAVDANGCSCQQRVELACPADGVWENHGQYVSCVARQVDTCTTARLISPAAGAVIISVAARSRVGER